ncbi:hypothetical protein BCR35DRAFT_305112 [Leucosporidium creatinivorum]|uniref:Uncharacterized protein n=1 Tax=Leucosporidium creatinivorum TaxID=106004 RepID=A0A1Y2F3N2_9BASI|nr:hypothetical protein BCR35DRAFT_305112 [Leucosporidium creatinivorum]
MQRRDSEGSPIQGNESKSSRFLSLNSPLRGDQEASRASAAGKTKIRSRRLGRSREVLPARLFVSFSTLLVHLHKHASLLVLT